MKRLNDHNDGSSRSTKYRNTTADVILSALTASEATIGEKMMTPADVVNEMRLRRWLKNHIEDKGDLERILTDDALKDFFAQHVGKKELYRFLFPSASQQLGEMLYNYLNSFVRAQTLWWISV